jgi:hypothetical protein
VDFHGDYSLQNPTQITQTIYVRFEFPATDASYSDFAFVIDGVASTGNNKTAEGITEAVTLAPGKSAKFTVAYKSRGTDRWGYSFGDTTRIRNFRLAMTTDFSEFDFPAGTGSPTERARTSNGWFRPIGRARAIRLHGPVQLQLFFRRAHRLDDHHRRNHHAGPAHDHDSEGELGRQIRLEANAARIPAADTKSVGGELTSPQPAPE